MNIDSYKLLVVDDDDFNRKMMKRLLEKEGYSKIDMADNGNLALQKIRENNYDAIMLDIEMPEIDGYGVLEHLQKDMRLRDIPVIMISGVEESASVIKCIKLGATDYLRKPIDPVLLHARLGACLEKKRLRDQQISYVSQLREEKKRFDKLLNVILPIAAANELKATGRVPPRLYQDVSILFCDIVGFTSYCERHSAEEVVDGLQELFEAFEEITHRNGMEKIKTIGDEFMASSGLLLPNEDPLLAAITCGLEMVEAAKSNTNSWHVRVGINQGPVIAGIVGLDKYQFDVWGNTVNTAARMTNVAQENIVVLPVEAWMSVQDRCDGRSLGMLDFKGKGQMEVVEAYNIRQ